MHSALLPADQWHVESLREHYALTLRASVQNLEQSYAQAVALVGPDRVRVWHLYLSAR